MSADLEAPRSRSCTLLCQAVPSWSYGVLELERIAMKPESLCLSYHMPATLRGFMTEAAGGKECYPGLLDSGRHWLSRHRIVLNMSIFHEKECICSLVLLSKESIVQNWVLFIYLFLLSLLELEKWLSG